MSYVTTERRLRFVATDRQTDWGRKHCIYYTENCFKGSIEHGSTGAVTGRCAATDVRFTAHIAALTWHRVLKSGRHRLSLCRHKRVSRFHEDIPSVELNILHLSTHWRICGTSLRVNSFPQYCKFSDFFFFSIHNAQPTKCTLCFLKYLY